MNFMNRSLRPTKVLHSPDGSKCVVASNVRDMEEVKVHDVASINKEMVYEFEIMESKLQYRILRDLYNAQRILDVGCGDGDFVSYLARFMKKEVTGLDISDSGFDKALAKAARYGIPNLVRCVKGDAHQIAGYFENEEFDAVTMIHTLHHLHQPVRALQELGRILKPNGRILIVDCIYSVGDMIQMMMETTYSSIWVEELEWGLILVTAESRRLFCQSQKRHNVVSDW